VLRAWQTWGFGFLAALCNFAKCHRLWRRCAVRFPVAMCLSLLCQLIHSDTRDAGLCRTLLR